MDLQLAGHIEYCWNPAIVCDQQRTWMDRVATGETPVLQSLTTMDQGQGGARETETLLQRFNFWDSQPLRIAGCEVSGTTPCWRLWMVFWTVFRLREGWFRWLGVRKGLRNDAGGTRRWTCQGGRKPFGTRECPTQAWPHRPLAQRATAARSAAWKGLCVQNGFCGRPEFFANPSHFICHCGRLVFSLWNVMVDLYFYWTMLPERVLSSWIASPITRKETWFQKNIHFSGFAFIFEHFLATVGYWHRIPAFFGIVLHLIPRKINWIFAFGPWASSRSHKDQLDFTFATKRIFHPDHPKIPIQPLFSRLDFHKIAIIDMSLIHTQTGILTRWHTLWFWRLNMTNLYDPRHPNGLSHIQLLWTHPIPRKCEHNSPLHGWRWRMAKRLAQQAKFCLL